MVLPGRAARDEEVVGAGGGDLEGQAGPPAGPARRRGRARAGAGEPAQRVGGGRGTAPRPAGGDELAAASAIGRDDVPIDERRRLERAPGGTTDGLGSWSALDRGQIAPVTSGRFRRGRARRSTDAGGRLGAGLAWRRARRPRSRGRGR